PRQNCRAREVDEQPVLDNAGYRTQQAREMRGVFYSSEVGIDNPVAAIGDEKVALSALSHHHLPGNATFRKRCGHRALGRREPERHAVAHTSERTRCRQPFQFVHGHTRAIPNPRDYRTALPGRRLSSPVWRRGIALKWPQKG